MSDLIIQPAVIESIEPHPDPETTELLIAKVLGWQLIINKNNGYSVGLPIVYVPPDTLLPKQLAQEMGIDRYLAELPKTHPDREDFLRTRAIKLRGEPSFGVTFPIPEGVNWELGENVSDFYGAKKYEPPVRVQGGDAEKDDPLLVKYTEIENIRNYPWMFVDGEEVSISEKIHGSSSRVAAINGVVMAGSHRLRRKQPESWEEAKSNLYWFPLTLQGPNDLINNLGGSYKQIILFGEVFGSRVQSFDYGHTRDLGYRAFDILIDGKYLDQDDFASLCDEYGIERVPILYRGAYSLDMVKKLADGPTTVGGNHIREGVVVRSVKERNHPRLGRVVGKYLGDKYLMKEKKTDYTEV